MKVPSGDMERLSIHDNKAEEQDEVDPVKNEVLATVKSSMESLSQIEIDRILSQQNGRPLSTFEISQLEKNAKKNWDIFYKTNTTNFFKDRHWTLREFPELLEYAKSSTTNTGNNCSEIVLLEAGCGVGNFVFPILEEIPSLFVFACDFSPRAVDFVRSNSEYNEQRVRAFTADLTEDGCFTTEDELLKKRVDFSSLIFVLSAISPSKQSNVIKNLSSVMKPGGILFFRDYGRYDMAQLRFKAGKKIQDNFYVRRDRTRSYYFTPEEVIKLFTEDNQFTCLQCEFIHRRTINMKEDLDVGRIFVQGKFRKV